jgi:hypothetical protein
MGKRGRTLGREIMIQFMHFKKDDFGYVKRNGLQGSEVKQGSLRRFYSL